MRQNITDEYIQTHQATTATTKTSSEKNICTPTKCHDK